MLGLSDRLMITITDLVSSSDNGLLKSFLTQPLFTLFYPLPLLVVLITIATVATHTSFPIIALSYIFLIEYTACV